mgnify:CR=1 FL=1
MLRAYGNRRKKSEIHKLIDPIAKEVLREVSLYQLPLTVIFDRFKQTSDSIGCANCYDLKPAQKSSERCKRNRDHYGELDKKYQSSVKDWNEKNITYKGTWIPKVGL